MSRQAEFSKKTKKAAWLRASGRCQCTCGCRLSLAGKVPHYDHINPETFSHDAGLANCQVLCVDCHDGHKTRIDRVTIAKSNRIGARHAGIRPDRTIRAWRGFDGRIIRKETQR